MDASLGELFEEAFERAGAEMRTGYDLRKARRCFNILTNEWTNRGFNLWTVEEASQAVASGDNTYSLDADTIDVLEHVIRSGATDYPLNRIKLNEWANRTNKSQTGRPTQVYIDRQESAVNLTLWPVPDQSYTLYYWRVKAITGLSSGLGTTANVSVPPRFIPALVSGLAYHVAQSRPESMQALPFLADEYERQWDLAAGEDRDRSTFRLLPGGYDF